MKHGSLFSGIGWIDFASEWRRWKKSKRKAEVITVANTLSGRVYIGYKITKADDVPIKAKQIFCDSLINDQGTMIGDVEVYILSAKPKNKFYIKPIYW